MNGGREEADMYWGICRWAGAMVGSFALVSRNSQNTFAQKVSVHQRPRVRPRLMWFL
jgi:hypothetical protein